MTDFRTNKKTKKVYPIKAKRKQPRYSDVKTEVVRAYDDRTRDLHFRASRPVSISEAEKIMDAALKDNGGEYNDFTPKELHKLNHIFEKPKVTLAREYSVCVYVHGKKKPEWTNDKIKKHMNASEADAKVLNTKTFELEDKGYILVL